MSQHTVSNAHQPWNIVVVVSDTLRTAFLRPYGKTWIHTPHLDEFARQSVRFTNAHPECLLIVNCRLSIVNFTRGFRQWEYIRGQADDRYRPLVHADETLLSRYRGGRRTQSYHDTPSPPPSPTAGRGPG